MEGCSVPCGGLNDRSISRALQRRRLEVSETPRVLRPSSLEAYVPGLVAMGLSGFPRDGTYAITWAGTTDQWAYPPLLARSRLLVVSPPLLILRRSQA